MLEKSRRTSSDRFTLAIDGGTPVRAKNLPYGRQSVSEADIDAVVRVLQSDWLTTGPEVCLFEKSLCEVLLLPT